MSCIALASPRKLVGDVREKGDQEGCAAVQGLWTDDGVDVWTLEASGRALFNGEWLGNMYDLRSIPSMRALVRGDGWATFLREATDTRLVWRKRGEEPIVWTRYVASVAQADVAKKHAIGSEASTDDEHLDAGGESGWESDGSVSRVRFDLSNISVFEVTPYSEVYGMHPRDFDFDADYALIPAQQAGMPPSSEVHFETDSEGSEEHASTVLCLDVLL